MNLVDEHKKNVDRFQTDRGEGLMIIPQPLPVLPFRLIAKPHR